MDVHFKFLFAAISLSLLTSACGDLNAFNDSISFKTASVKQNGLAEVSGGVAFNDKNTAVDLMVTYIPKNKDQSNTPTIANVSGSILTYGNGNSVSQNFNMSPTNFPSETPSGSFHDETQFRAMENELLKNRFTQIKIAARSANLFKTNDFNKGDMWNGGIKVMKTLGNSSVWATIQARCVAVTDEAYFFEEENAINKIDAALLSKYTAGFTKIYPIVVEKFDKPNDVDQNGKVIILLYDMGEKSKTLGYFYSADKYAKSAVQVSNQADIFYINSNYAKQSNQADIVLGTLAHELQHMIYFDLKYNNIAGGVGSWNDYEGDSWLNEGLSMLGEFYTNYHANVNSWIVNFMHSNYQGLSLTHWTSVNYGYSAIFTRYLAEKTDNLTKKIYSSNRGGLQAVEIASGKDFNDIFADFVQTIYLSHKNINTDPYYNLVTLEPDLSKYIFGSVQMKPGEEKYISLKPYEFRLIKIDGNTTKIAIPEKLQGYSRTNF